MQSTKSIAATARSLPRRLGTAVSIGALLGLLSLGAVNAAAAGESTPPSSVSVSNGAIRSLQLGVGRSVIVDLPEDATEIFVGEPKVANAIVRSARRIYISTLSAGQTTIFALGPNGRKIAVLEVSVGRDVGELSQLLKAAVPENDIHVRTVGDSIILTGEVASAGDAQKALDIASGFLSTAASPAAGPAAGAAPAAAPGAPGGGKIVNSLTIRGLDQVSLRVTITEIRRDIVKQLGLNLTGVGGTSGLLSLTTQNQFSVNSAPIASQAVLGWMTGGEKLTATLQAYEQQGVARTLAEPTVTAVSGERAKFLAGGTVPIPNGENCQGGFCTISFIQQPYGVTLNFTPVVLSQGRIQLRVGTEVTDIDPSKNVTLGTVVIPGFRTRKNETTVELPSGGSIASAGLISTQTQSAINGVPGLLNLPILGALFRSHDYLRQETELLIVVTPYIVHAIDPKEVVRPDQNFADASSPQSWLLGRINRIYSSSNGLQPMPGYSGKVGFITD